MMEDTQRVAWQTALFCYKCPQASQCPHFNCYRRFPSAMGGANECPRIPVLAPVLGAHTFGDVLAQMPPAGVLMVAHVSDRPIWPASDGPHWAIPVGQVGQVNPDDWADVLSMPVDWSEGATVCYLDTVARGEPSDAVARRVARVGAWARAVGGCLQ